MPIPSATQAAGEPHTALWCCSALPEAPTHHDQRSSTSSRPLPKAGRQLGIEPGEAGAPPYPPRMSLELRLNWELTLAERRVTVR